MVPPHPAAAGITEEVKGALRAGDGKAAPDKPGRLSVTFWMTSVMILSRRDAKGIGNGWPQPAVP